MTSAPLAVFFIAAVAGMVACAPYPADGAGDGAFAELTVTPDRLRAGDSLELTLTNRSEQQLGYNLCTSAIERRTAAGEWEVHPVPLAEVCTMELRVLDPGASDTFRHNLPALQPGTYRFRAGVEWPLGGDRVGVTSTTFDVVS
ncbi:MAG TPA: hypothetical protein VK929_08665 [Longimicrobiales bacterium]|nr:hypothetical protein [Longimicrobiales bacterium]